MTGRSFLVSVAFALTVPRASGAYDIHVSPTTGVAPLRISGSVTIDAWIYDVWVDMGGQVTYMASCERSPQYFDCGGETWDAFLEHEFSCPGTYEIVVTRFESPQTILASATIEVVEPAVPSLGVEAGGSAYEVSITTTPDVASRVVELAVVEWGDGFSEPFEWIERDGLVATPTHLYAADGEYNAKITLYYSGRYCSYTQTPTITVTIPNPGTPTRASTWGSVKALYR